MQINATEMKPGDVISFHGAEFTLGEVFSRDGVYWSTGVTTSPAESMINNPYFYDALTVVYSWTFQGNSLRMLVKVN